MPGSHEFLKALALVLGVAAATTVLFQRLRQPVVLGYVLAGVIVGPHVPIPLVADRAVVHTLSELGVILLMFSIGLEFSLRKLLRLGAVAGLTALVQCSIMVWLGYLVGRAFGWTPREALFTGAIIAISSTTIIAKAFDERRVTGRLRELVVGVLIVEDLIGIFLMAMLTAVSRGDGLSLGAAASSTGRLAAFLLGVEVVGLLLVPRAIRAVLRLKRPETTLVTSVGLCFGLALLAQEAGYSVALGAFIAGSLVAESGEERAVEHVIGPVKDMFAAIFFVSVGMLIDPSLIARHWVAVTVLSAVVIVGKIVSVSLGAFLTGNGTRLSVRAGMSLAQIGEFSFIIAGLGISLHATGDFLYPVAVAVSAVTTLTTPWLIGASGRAASFVDRKLPRPLQTFASLYASWFERMRAAPTLASRGSAPRRISRFLALDAVLLAALLIGTSLLDDRATAEITRRTALSPAAAHAVFVALGAIVCAPFAVGIFRVARRLAVALAELALPSPPAGAGDLAVAPRRALVVTLHLAVVLLVGAPLVALTQPFLPGLQVAMVLVLVIATLLLTLWRDAADLNAHVRAVAQTLLEGLATLTHDPAAPRAQPSLDELGALLPGMGALAKVTLDPQCAAVGRSLAEIDLRGRTGASVLAITNGADGVSIPTAVQRLRAGDVLALSGSAAAVEAASALLRGEASRDTIAPDAEPARP
ncbi:MAG: cation:proton antiporter [Deltaproteobacteria bacterium]|nr:cation:proton antiporter [Myxococcales bacterium]MDP3214722.1 cation:proton antiporter [Deltaproteobacteria bacterium]